MAKKQIIVVHGNIDSKVIKALTTQEIVQNSAMHEPWIKKGTLWVAGTSSLHQMGYASGPMPWPSKK